MDLLIGSHRGRVNVTVASGLARTVNHTLIVQLPAAKLCVQHVVWTPCDVASCGRIARGDGAGCLKRAISFLASKRPVVVGFGRAAQH